MSRTRARTTPIPSYIYEFGYPSENGAWSSRIDCGTPNMYNAGGSEAYYAQYSTIIDQIPAQHLAVVDWKNVDHLKKNPGRQSVKVKYNFSPPVPPVWIDYDWRPSPTTSSLGAISWDQYLDDLASQLEKGSDSSFQALVFIAEARKTWEMIRNPLSFLRPMWRKGALKHSARSLSETASSMWLGYRYGWTPFFLDVTSFSKMAATLMNKSNLPGLLERFSSGSVSTESFSNIAGTATPAGFRANVNLEPRLWQTSSGFLFYVKSREIKTTARVCCYAFDPMARVISKIDKFLSASGATLTWRNIRDFTWEVLPFSFVIDWFVDFSSIWRPLNENLILSKSANRVGYSVKREFRDIYAAVCGKPQLCNRGSSQWRGNLPVDLKSPTFECEGRSSSYVRYEGLPANTAGVFKNRGLSLIHGIDGVSLILSDLSRVKH